MHQIANLPHQRLMLIDDRLRGAAVVVETWSRHLRLDLTDGLLGLSNTRFEILDARSSRRGSACAFACVGIRSLLLFVRRPRRRDRALCLVRRLLLSAFRLLR